PDVNDGVASATVGDHGARFFDQRLAGSFYGYARHDGAARISNHAGNRALGRRDRRHYDQNHDRHDDVPNELARGHLPLLSIPAIFEIGKKTGRVASNVSILLTGMIRRPSSVF